MSDVEVRPAEVPVTNDGGEHELFAHIVIPASAVTAAYVTGAEVVALCGKRWVPTRDPTRYPVCPDCLRLLRELGDDLG